MPTRASIQSEFVLKHGAIIPGPILQCFQ